MSDCSVPTSSPVSLPGRLAWQINQLAGRANRPVPLPHNPYPACTLLTRAPLLSRIMNMMKDSNQLCSTIWKQVFLNRHQAWPRPSVVWISQHWKWRTHTGGDREKNLCFKERIKILVNDKCCDTSCHFLQICIEGHNFPDAFKLIVQWKYVIFC